MNEMRLTKWVIFSNGCLEIIVMNPTTHMELEFVITLMRMHTPNMSLNALVNLKQKYICI